MSAIIGAAAAAGAAGRPPWPPGAAAAGRKLSGSGHCAGHAMPCDASFAFTAPSIRLAFSSKCGPSGIFSGSDERIDGSAAADDDDDEANAGASDGSAAEDDTERKEGAGTGPPEGGRGASVRRGGARGTILSFVLAQGCQIGMLVQKSAQIKQRKFTAPPRASAAAAAAARRTGSPCRT